MSAESAVGGGRPAHADDDAPGPRFERCGDQLAGAVGGRRDRIVARSTADELQTRSLCHLDDGGAARKPPTGGDIVAERTRYLGEPVRSAEGVEQALAAISHRAADHAVPAGFERGGDGLGGLGRGDGATELVRSDEDTHEVKATARSGEQTAYGFAAGENVAVSGSKSRPTSTTTRAAPTGTFSGVAAGICATWSSPRPIDLATATASSFAPSMK